MSYACSVDVENGTVVVNRDEIGLSFTYFRRLLPGRLAQRYTAVVRDDIIPPRVVLEIARDDKSGKVDNPKNLMPSLENLLAKLPDIPSDARELIKLIYSK